jgi:Ner family transcriptional regulator
MATPQAPSQVSPRGEDWHPADIVAALRKAGWSLRRLSVHHGYRPGQLASATFGPWPKGERLIAAAIGVAPEVIWPSRWAVRAEREARLSPRARANRAKRQALASATNPSTPSLDDAA